MKFNNLQYHEKTLHLIQLIFITQHIKRIYYNSGINNTPISKGLNYNTQERWSEQFQFGLADDPNPKAQAISSELYISNQLWRRVLHSRFRLQFRV